MRNENKRLQDTIEAGKDLDLNPVRSIQLLEKYYQTPIIDDLDISQLKLLSTAYRKINDDARSEYYNNLCVYFDKNRESEITSISDSLDDCLVKLLSDFNDIKCPNADLLIRSILLYFELCRKTESAILYLYYSTLFGRKTEIEELICYRTTNILALYNELLHKSCGFVIICNDSTINEINSAIFLEKILLFFGHSVTFISGKELLSREHNVVLVEPVKEESVLDALCYIEKKNTYTAPLVVLCDAHLLKKVYRIKHAYKLFEVYYRQSIEIPTLYYDCFLFGDFYKTASFIYGFNVKETLLEKPELDYSIVIPARNSAKYLEFAIETCLHVDYDKKRYEILISDNSDENNSEIAELVSKYQEKCKCIRYIKPPRVLPLSGSFEFAYLNARGQRIISIGSDDGVMPSILSELTRLFHEYNTLLVHFQSYQYVWPDEYGYAYLTYDDLSFSGKKDEIVVKSDSVFDGFVRGDFPFQFLPILYMNTCIHKSLIKRIIDATGKFEFGYSQDVYTGVINSMILDSFVYTRKPLIIGGESDIGIGRNGMYYQTFPKTHKFKIHNSTMNSFNYYSEASELFHFNGYYTSNERWFIFTEYRKISDLLFFEGKKNYSFSNEELLESLKSMYSHFDFSSGDKNVFFCQTHLIAESFGEEFYSKFISRENGWIAQKEKKGKREFVKLVFKRLKLYNLLKLIKYEIHRTKRVIKKNRNDSSYSENNVLGLSFRPSICEMSKKTRIVNVFEASRYLCAKNWNYKRNKNGRK